MVSLGGKASLLVQQGDVLRIETPGGGGWGRKGQDQAEAKVSVKAFEPIAAGSLAALEQTQADF